MAVAAELPWTLGDKLAKARRCAGLEQAEMAIACGVSRALVSKWERDASEPSVSQAMTWAQATGVSFEWLTRSGYNSLNTFQSVEWTGQMELLDEEGRVLAAPELAVI